MKLNKETLKKIIKEELGKVLNEDDIYDDDPGHRVGKQSPVPELDNHPMMGKEELVVILLGKDQLGHPHPGIGGFGDYDTNMYELRQFLRDNAKDPKAIKISQALEDPRIKTKRKK
jgi:hypothetical protein